VAVAIIVSLFLIFSGRGTRKVEKNINPITGEEIIPGQIPGQI